MWPHRRQPTRLPRPWDSPGKNSGVGCHFLLQSMKVKSEREVAQSCPTLSDLMDCSLPGSSIHGTFQARVLERGAIAFSEIYDSKYTKSKAIIIFYSKFGQDHSVKYSCLFHIFLDTNWIKKGNEKLRVLFNEKIQKRRVTTLDRTKIYYHIDIAPADSETICSTI